MHIFSKPKYESSFTLFLNAYKQRNPTVQEDQRAGLALLWDKMPIDKNEHDRAAASTVKRSAYVYE